MDIDYINPNQDVAGLSVAYTGTAGSTATYAPGPLGVWVWTTSDAYVRVGEAVTATTAGLPLPAYTPVIMKVPKGTGAPWRVSAIQVAAGGTVYTKPV